MNCQFVLLFVFCGFVSTRPLNESENTERLRICGTKGTRLVDQGGPETFPETFPETYPEPYPEPYPETYPEPYPFPEPQPEWPGDPNETPIPFKNKIYGGVPATGSESPWAVYIGMGVIGKGCSGTLISSRHILTASHCLTDNERVGEILEWSTERCIHNIVWKLSDGTVYPLRDGVNKEFKAKSTFQKLYVFLPDGTQSSAKVVRMVAMNLCMSEFYTDDVMIMELNEDIPYSDTVNPACVSDTIRNNLPGSKVDIYSYGADDPNLQGQLGRGTLRRTSLTITEMIIDNKMFEASDLSYQSAIREGDSGGGYMKNVNGRTTVVGVVSNGGDWVVHNPSVGYYYQHICSFAGICNEDIRLEKKDYSNNV